MSKKRKRIRFNFWLDDNDEIDMELALHIKKMKKARKFTQAIRDGLRLLQSLMLGETQLLFEMFPSIRETLYAQMEADVIERYNIQQSHDMVQHIIELKGVVTQLKNQPILAAPMEGTVTMTRVSEYEEVTLQVEQVSSTGNAAQNFLNSMMALQADTDNGVKKLSVPQFEAPVFDDDADMIILQQS